jgi:hypothetical protein
MGASRGLGRSVVEEAVWTFACLDVVVKRLSDITQPLPRIVATLQ